MRVMQLVVVLVLLCTPALAQEFYVLGGVVDSNNLAARSYSWQLEYMLSLNKYFDASLSYLNEGHLSDHHRDGDSLQLWTHTDLFDSRISLAVGAGPYYFYDSTSDTARGPYVDDHGFGGMFSFAATYHMDSRWLLQLRTNWVKIGNNFDTVSAVAGIGYQLEPLLSASEQNPDKNLQNNITTNNSVTLYLGQTVLNSLERSQGVATSIEYRKGLYRYLDWTASWLYEGNPSLLRRNGGITQMWAVRPFLDDYLSLGAGLGVYIPIDGKLGVTEGENKSKLISGIFSMTTSYRFYPHLETRVTWNRILTNYNMDADVFLGGIGYLF
jgi:hypothetical protein